MNICSTCGSTRSKEDKITPGLLLQLSCKVAVHSSRKSYMARMLTLRTYISRYVWCTEREINWPWFNKSGEQPAELEVFPMNYAQLCVRGAGRGNKSPAGTGFVRVTREIIPPKPMAESVISAKARYAASWKPLQNRCLPGARTGL